jgi:hypothetical protein
MGGSAGGIASRDHVARAFVVRFTEEAKELSDDRQQAFLKACGRVLPSLIDAHGVLYQAGLHERLNLQQPLRAICSDGVALIGKSALGDETLRAAQLTYAAISEVLETILAPSPDPMAMLSAGMSYGGAEVRLTQVTSGLWEIVASADANSQIAMGLADTRKSGGKARGAELKKQAAGWKEKLFPVAERLDREHPEWDRQKLAMEIIFKTDLKEVGLRSVEDWLKNEAEEPNGPLRRRGRKQRAKQGSQVS